MTDNNDSAASGFSRRKFIAGAAGTAVAPMVAESAAATSTTPQDPSSPVNMTLDINGERKSLAIDARTTLLDALREHVGLTGSKKGCDHGQCGACTVLIDGRRVVSCLTLALAAEGQQIQTIEGLAKDGQLHPMQQAFADQDAFQCGYCTPGQICSAIGMLSEFRSGAPSAVTLIGAAPTELTDEEVRERMSGNLCRCGAYVGIRDAIHQAQGEMSR
jgi:xanthine dehydrogenase YagT iron-sulfur-binding subunit